MPKVYTARVQQQADFERVCSNCGHQWLASFGIVASTYVESTRQAAAKAAEDIMHEEKRDRFDNREVLCPKCLHFSVDAMYRHFRKGGYPAGILKKYKRAAWINLPEFLGVVWIPVLLLFFANLNPLNAATPALSVVWLIVFLSAGGVALYRLIGLLCGLAALPSVRRKLGQLPDGALLELAVKCYKQNKNSLAVSGIDEIRWNPWLSGPLRYKPPPSREND